MAGNKLAVHARRQNYPSSRKNKAMTFDARAQSLSEYCRRPITLVSLLLVATLVSGCGDLRDRFKDPETRIEQAFPPSAEVTALALEAAKAADPIAGRRALISSETTVFRKRRALECAKGVNPTWRDSTHEIRAQLKDVACFAKLDAELLSWVRRIHVGTHLLLPPVPFEPTTLKPSILINQDMLRVKPADNGPLALVTHARGWELLDLRTGEKLRQATTEPGAPPGPKPSLSSNARVVLNSPSGRLLLEEIESGRVLEDLGAGGITSFRWVGPTMAVAFTDKGRKSHFVDYKTGLLGTLPLDGPEPYRAALPTTDPLEYLLFGREHARLVRVGSMPSALTITELRDLSLRGSHVTPEMSAVSSDGRRFLAVLSQMTLVDLQTAESSPLGLWPGLVLHASPHGEPNKFFLSATIDVARPATFVFDVQDQSVARVADAGERGSNWTYWPSAKRYVVAGSGRVQVVESPPPTEATESLDALFAQVQQVANERKLAAAAQPLPAPRSVRPQLAVPVGARVLAVGAYESKSGMHGIGRPRVAGSIDVTVSRTAYPVVLVLTSYEPVNWRLQLMPGAQLSGILLFGYYESVVVGQGDAKIHRGGQLYAHERSSREFDKLNREVERLTGLEINSFQGAYSTKSFSVGSW